MKTEKMIIFAPRGNQWILGGETRISRYWLIVDAILLDSVDGLYVADRIHTIGCRIGLSGGRYTTDVYEEKRQKIVVHRDYIQRVENIWDLDTRWPANTVEFVLSLKATDVMNPDALEKSISELRKTYLGIGDEG